ncbi:MAG TPA: class I lanthipeptide [Gemmatimonadaceae bacterium]|nr:class I lanthipeptide [Gemmatimonadaceae bacterium]
MKKNKTKLQLKKDTIRVLRHSELTDINGATCLELTLVGTQCVALVNGGTPDRE